jgi:phospholipid/cholesterol/gamma-HCH transport system ATP-binding protein
MDQPIIELQEVCKAFEGKAVLRDLSLKVERGTTLVILGVSGSGKTVLLKHMVGLVQPDRGRVLVDGVDLAVLSGPELARVRERFGVVFQNSALFDGLSVFDNLALPLRERHRHMPEAEVARRVGARLELFDLGGAQEQRPGELSGGMRKRVAIARAVILEPEVVLYDEPTAGLDPLLADSVDQMIMRARTTLGVTSVVITQDLAAAFRMADQMAFLDGGRITVSGTPAELRASKDPDLHRYLATWEEARREAIQIATVS